MRSASVGAPVRRGRGGSGRQQAGNPRKNREPMEQKDEEEELEEEEEDETDLAFDKDSMHQEDVDLFDQTVAKLGSDTMTAADMDKVTNQFKTREKFLLKAEDESAGENVGIVLKMLVRVKALLQMDEKITKFEQDNAGAKAVPKAQVTQQDLFSTEMRRVEVSRQT